MPLNKKKLLHFDKYTRLFNNGGMAKTLQYQQGRDSAITYDADAQLYFDQLTGPVSDAYKIAVNTLVLSLKADGNWSELDRLWIHATENQQNARISLVNPTSTAITEVNTPTWTASKGYSGNGVNMYLNTNYKPSANGVKYIQNSATAFVYLNQVNDTSAGLSYTMGGYDAASRQTDFSYSTVFGGSGLNSIGADAVSGAFVTNGLFQIVRTASNVVKGYVNDVIKLNTATVSSARPGVNMFLLCRNAISAPASYSSNRISISGFGSGNVDHTTFYTAINTLSVSLGFNT